MAVKVVQVFMSIEGDLEPVSRSVFIELEKEFNSDDNCVGYNVSASKDGSLVRITAHYKKETDDGDILATFKTAFRRFEDENGIKIAGRVGHIPNVESQVDAEEYAPFTTDPSDLN